MPSGSVVEGSLVAAFEEEFSSLMGGRRCIAVNRGFPSVSLALAAVGIGAGDEVVVASYGTAEAADAVRLAGAEPVFADIDPRTYCLDPEAVELAMTARTAAVVVGHRFGHPAAMWALRVLAGRYGLAVVEDATQAFGAELDGRLVGTFGTVAAFALGVVTPDPLVARKARERRPAEGAPTQESAAAGRAELEELAGASARRRATARVLDTALKGVLVPYAEPGARHVYEQYVVRVPGNGRPDRDAFAKALARRGVKAGIPVATPVHRLPPYRSAAELPHTERAAAETLALPVDPLLSVREVERIVASCNALGGLL